MSTTGSTRGNPAMSDIVRSMVVIAVIVLAVWGFGKFFTTDPGDPVKPVDYASVVAQARPSAGFPLLAPDTLPEGWRANSARFDPTSWHLGVLTGDDEYIGLEQTTVGVDRAVDLYADGSKLDGTLDIDGQEWTVRTGKKDRFVLVRREDGVTTLVDSTAPRDVVTRYVSSLSTS